MTTSLKKDSTFDKCPECKTVGALRRSRAKSFWEVLVKKTGFADMYRCRECSWRGIKYNFSLRKISLKVVLMYILFLLFVAVFVRFVILKFVIK